MGKVAAILAAFFHIPLPEFIEAGENTTAQHFTHNNVKGVRGEYSDGILR